MVSLRGVDPLSVMKDTWSNDHDFDPVTFEKYSEYFENLKKTLLHSLEQASGNADQAQRKYTHHYNLRSKDKEFSV